MFKMSFSVYRRPDLTREQFLKHWKEVHAPLAVKFAKELKIRRYVQLHGIDTPAADLMTQSRGCQPPHDGVVELWWDSEEDRLAVAGSEAGAAAGAVMKADELNFCDMSRATICFGYEHVVIDDGKPV